MKINLICPSCRKTYVCTPHNTNIKNPILTTVCQKCGEIYKGNVSAYAFSQAEYRYIRGRIERAAFMITLMQNVAFVANDDKHGVKIRKYTRKRWNTQPTT